LLGLEKAMDEANILAAEVEKKLMSFDENLQGTLSPILSAYINRHR
jgi:farnesyl diphosphate synthase